MYIEGDIGIYGINLEVHGICNLRLLIKAAVIDEINLLYYSTEYPQIPPSIFMVVLKMQVFIVESSRLASAIS